jgi:signal transduction histidine kinase
VSRVRDRLAPMLAGLLVVVVAVGVVLLLRLAGDQGTKALTTAKLGEVDAIANSFNARYAAQISAVAGLGGSPWELTPGSKADKAVLKTFDVNADAEAGYFLIDAKDTITAGVLLRKGRLGTRYTPPGWEAAKRRLASEPAIVLPVVTTGQTTELPGYGFAVAIRGPAKNSVRGALIFEQALTASSPFQQEILQLGNKADPTAAWFFLDGTGSVVASTDGTALGRAVEDGRYRTQPAGVTKIGARIVVTADVPALDWRVVYREDRSQFVSPLSGPLQKTGFVLVLLLLSVGLAMVVVFVRRLRESREQERRLRDLTRSQGRFISIVSHELRTPVAGVLGFLQTTVDHWPQLSDEDRFIAVGRAVTNAKRLEALTRDVLDIDWIESGRTGYAVRRVDVGEELRAAAEISQGLDATHTVTLAVSSETIHVDVDPDRVQQVLAILLDNARKNAPQGEPIVIEADVVGSDPQCARVSVIDRGPGIDPETQELIFDKFVRADDDAVTGTGLGLYLARRIIEAHGGRIWCESDPGSQRTAFTFELPVAPPTAAEPGSMIPGQARAAHLAAPNSPPPMS